MVATGNILRQCCRATVTNSVFFIILLSLGAPYSALIILNVSYFHSAGGKKVHRCYHINLPTLTETHIVKHNADPPELLLFYQK